MKDDIIINGYKIDGRMPIFQQWGRDAIREGRKTQTRKTNGLERINENPDQCTEIVNIGAGQFQAWKEREYPVDSGFIGKAFKCFYGKPGDIRVMREPLSKSGSGHIIATNDFDDNEIHCDPRIRDKNHNLIPWRWKRDTLSSLFMPTEYGRTLLEITDIRAERIRDISWADCLAEGIDDSDFIDQKKHGDMYPMILRDRFENLWDSINKKRGYDWESNPWVWKISFKRLT